MKCHQVYRAWCHVCKRYLSWQEPSGRSVDKLLCPGCGRLVDAVKGTSIRLMNELICEARTFVEKKT